MTEEMIQGEKKFIAEWNRMGLFIYFYPLDLYEVMTPKNLTVRVGYFAEGRFESLSTLDIFYDGNTNYIGFSAATEEKAR
jgi:hypothetical protein